MKKIIIDTDPGHDDAMAIMMAVKSQRFNIQAFTTVCGNSTIENTTRNTRFIVDLLGKNEIPIYSGAQSPLKKELIQAVVHGQSGLDGIDPTNESELTHNAVEKMIELIKKSPGEITLVTLGPLTNIAQAIEKDPETMKQVKEIVMMGGAIRVPGNKNRVAEFNIFVDPDAAQKVMDFPIKKNLVPLDACNQVRLFLQDFDQITDPTLRSPLLKMVKPYIANIAKDEGVEAALMYDPLTIFYLLSPESCNVQNYNIKIETNSQLTRGMTVADLRKIPDTKEINCKVVEWISEEAFKKSFIQILNS